MLRAGFFTASVLSAFPIFPNFADDFSLADSVCSVDSIVSAAFSVPESEISGNPNAFLKASQLKNKRQPLSKNAGKIFVFIIFIPLFPAVFGFESRKFFGNTGLNLSINPDGVTNKCNWNSESGDIKGTDIKSALSAIASNPGFVSMPNGDIAAAMKSGDVIAGISGVWDVMNVKAIYGENYGACKLPTYTVAGKEVQMSSFTGYKMMGVNAYSENRDWACRLADWMTNEDNQKLRFKERNQGPSNINVAASDEVKKVPAIQAVIEQSKYGTLQRVGNSFWDACKDFGDTILSGTNNGMTDQELMDKLVNGITASTIK